MKRTLTYLAFAAAAAIAFSCEKETATVNEEVITPQEEETVVPATDEYDPSVYLVSFGAKFENEDTKATVDVDAGTVAFENDDKAIVYVPATGDTGVYTYDGTQFTADATPVALGENAAEVYYPASSYDVDGGAVKFTMPTAVTDLADLGTKNPMAGQIAAGDHSAGITVNFKNVCSILRVQLTGNRALASLTLANDNVPIAAAGEYTVSWSGEDPQIASSATNYSATITSDAALSDSATDFFFLLPPTAGTMNNMKITATMEAADGLGLSSYVLKRSGAMTLVRNKIFNVPFFAGLFSGGTGADEANAFIIANSRDFKNIQNYSVNGYDNGNDAAIPAATFLGAYYKQTAAITAGNITPIGTSTAPFTGVYDGQDNELTVTISTTTDNTGVFGYIQDAAVQNLTVAGTVESSGQFTAGIAGQMAEASKITGCTNQAAIKNTNSTNAYAAGIVGRALNTSEIVSCVNEGEITASKAFAAGIVGDMTGTIDMCVNKNTVTGGSNTGGIAGALRASSTIRRCYSSKSKTITGTNRVGGIVGYNVAGTVANCFSNSNVTITSNTEYYGAGGLVGILGGLLFNSATGDITVKCSASCSDKNNALVNVGGLVGRQTGGTIQNVYTPVYAKDIKIGSIHGRSGSGKIGQIVGVVASGNLCAYYFGGCATATTGWQYWGTNSGSGNYDGQWAFTSANTVSMDWTAPVAKDFSGFGQSLASGEYHLKDVLNIDKSSSAKYSAYTPVEGEAITWSDLSASDFHAIPDALMALGEAYYSE